MDYVVSDEKVQPGDLIATSGEDRIFPKDFPIGTVESAKPGNPFQTIRVHPAARLDRLEDVIVLLSQQQVVFKKPEVSAPAAAPVRTPSVSPSNPTQATQQKPAAPRP
jgi:rod shape-determining protein MreC